MDREESRKWQGYVGDVSCCTCQSCYICEDWDREACVGQVEAMEAEELEECRRACWDVCRQLSCAER